MPLNNYQTAIATAAIFDGAPGATAGITRPIRIGARPYTERTAKKRPVRLRVKRDSSNATADYQDVSIWGADLGNLAKQSAVDTSTGRLSPLIHPYTGADLGLYQDIIRVSGGAATGISFIRVLDGGYGYTSAPTVVFTGGGGSSAAATAVVRNGRVVGIYVTNAGSGYTSAPVISFTGGAGSGAKAVTQVGQQVTINTHIPFATHTPDTAGSAYWAVLIDDGQRILTYDTSLFLTGADGNLEPNQHVMGTNANGGFSVATGTHPDGTTTIGVVTLNLGLPNDVVVRVVRTKTQLLLAAAANLISDTQQIATSLMWAKVGGATDNSHTNIVVEPVI